jgi:hypothetical protein
MVATAPLQTSLITTNPLHQLAPALSPSALSLVNKIHNQLLTWILAFRMTA